MSVKIPEITRKYCVYNDTWVVASGFNRDGRCPCMNCKEDKCSPTCSECRHLRRFLNNEENPCIECLNATEAYKQTVALTTVFREK